MDNPVLADQQGWMIGTVAEKESRISMFSVELAANAYDHFIFISIETAYIVLVYV